MYREAIESISKFTRPIHTITRTLSNIIQPGSSTMFFVNENGVAITCKHVLETILISDKINLNYKNYKNEIKALPKNRYKGGVKALQKKYGYRQESIIGVKNNFMNSFDNITDITYHLHDKYDLAIIEFKGFNETYYEDYAVFVTDEEKVKQGKTLCRLGYPFPEFTNFQLNEEIDDIEWTNTGNSSSPNFPIDGIITRFLLDDGKQMGIEMSTPGLKGQSGGPLFDEEGYVYGMQFATSHLHLGFDLMNKEIISNGKKNKVSNFPFLHVGWCIHVQEIKDFLDEHDIEYYEE